MASIHWGFMRSPLRECLISKTGTGPIRQSQRNVAAAFVTKKGNLTSDGVWTYTDPANALDIPLSHWPALSRGTGRVDLSTLHSAKGICDPNRVPLAWKEDVLRPDVAVDDAGRGSGLKATGDLDGDRQHVVEPAPVAVHGFGNLAALGARHDKVLLRVVTGNGIERGVIEQRHDVRVREYLDRVDLVAEALMALGVEHALEGTGPLVLSHKIFDENNLGLATLIERVAAVPSAAKGPLFFPWACSR